LDRPLADEADGGIVADMVPARDDGIGRAETRAMSHHYLSRLPHRNRAVILLRFHEDLKQREIGELLGISQMHVLATDPAVAGDAARSRGRGGRATAGPLPG
jgi:RNA polymerase sigma-B factor